MTETLRDFYCVRCRRYQTPALACLYCGGELDMPVDFGWYAPGELKWLESVQCPLLFAGPAKGPAAGVNPVAGSKPEAPSQNEEHSMIAQFADESNRVPIVLMVEPNTAIAVYPLTEKPAALVPVPGAEVGQGQVLLRSLAERVHELHELAITLAREVERLQLRLEQSEQQLIRFGRWAGALQELAAALAADREERAAALAAGEQTGKETNNRTQPEGVDKTCAADPSALAPIPDDTASREGTGQKAVG